MEIKKENKFIAFCKRYGLLCASCLVAIVVALAIGLNVPKDEPKEPASSDILKFDLPMKGAVVVKDYDENRLQWNEALGRYQIHLAIDFSSEQTDVFSVLDGVVAEVESNSLDGQIIKIQHADGFVSVYSSLGEDAKVNVGDKVTKGQLIGCASTSATNEKVDGGHLHFELLKDGVEVDPNNYLDLQNK